MGFCTEINIDMHVIRVGQIALIFRCDHPIDQRSLSDDLIEKIFLILSLIGLIRFWFALKFPINLRHQS